MKKMCRLVSVKRLKKQTPQQIFQAVSYAVKEAIVDDWLATQKTYEKEDPKTVYYMSMEFLMGRALGNNLINMTAYKEVKEALDEMGIDLNVVEDQEPDAALGKVVWIVLQLASWIHLHLLDTQLTAVESVTATVCSNRRSKMAIR